MFNLQMMVTTYKIYRSVVEFPIESRFTHLNRKCLRCRPFKSNWQRCCTRSSKYAVSIWAVPFWNKPPAEIPRLNTSRHSWTTAGDPCSLKYPYNTPPSRSPFPLHTLTHFSKLNKKGLYQTNIGQLSDTHVGAQNGRAKEITTKRPLEHTPSTSFPV